MGVTTIIPALNEESTVREVVLGALKHSDKVIVVNDGSEDQTAEEAAKAGAQVITHITRLGTGGALSTGFQAGLKTQHEYFVTIDADGQHDTEEIPKVLDPILKNEADIVVGSRLLEQKGHMPFNRKLGNAGISKLTSLILKTRVTDSQSGFRAYRRKVLENIIHQTWDYSWASETLLQAAKQHYRIKEVPITTIYFSERKRGVNAKDGWIIFHSTWRRSLGSL